jgi:dephospho-CoA kinase
LLRIGLTGGIGSGKSTVAKIFEVLGIPVYYADDEAKRLMNEDPGLIEEIIRHFGEKAYNSSGLDRSYLAKIVFNDAGKLRLLNSLTHPRTISHAESWISAQSSPYIIKEAALLFESGAYKQLDKIIGVSAPLELRISRVMERDGSTREDVLKRISRQMNEDEKLSRCDFIINNDETDAIVPQVLKLHEQFSGVQQARL